MLRDRLLHLFLRRRWRGFETLFRLSGSRRIMARTCYGARFALDPHEYVDSTVLREGFYESEVFERLRTSLRSGDVFWDVGACFGLHAVSIASAIPNIAVHAFEPNPVGQMLIRENAALNRVPVQLWPLALDEREGESDFFVPARGNSGMATLRPFAGGRFQPAGKVATARADQLIASGRIAAPCAIKLDVEGSEIAVLRGFGASLRDARLRLIVFEAAPDVLDADSVDPVRQLLISSGFHLEALPRNEATAHQLINIAAARP